MLPSCNYWRLLRNNRLIAGRTSASNLRLSPAELELRERLLHTTSSAVSDIVRDDDNRAALRTTPPIARSFGRRQVKKSPFLDLFEAPPATKQQVRPITTSAADEMASGDGKFTITLDNMNPCLKKMEYAVRGPLVIRATEIEKEILKVSRLTFIIHSGHFIRTSLLVRVYMYSVRRLYRRARD